MGNKKMLDEKLDKRTSTVKALDECLNGCVKHVSKDYICYRRDWLYDHLDEEFAVLKRCRDMKVPNKKEVENGLDTM